MPHDLVGRQVPHGDSLSPVAAMIIDTGATQCSIRVVTAK